VLGERPPVRLKQLGLLPDAPKRATLVTERAEALAFECWPRAARCSPTAARDPDISAATYVWLPIRFDGELPYLDWSDRWRIEDHR
jgi:hypothetical protein